MADVKYLNGNPICDSVARQRIEELEQGNSVVVDLENGNYDTTKSNRYDDYFSANLINRKPIRVYGATGITVSGLPATISSIKVISCGSTGTVLSTQTVTVTNGKTGTVTLPAGTYYVDLNMSNFDYRQYTVRLSATGGTEAPKQVKRIYSNENGNNIIRFHLDKESNLNTTVCFKLPPNYTSDQTAVPLVIFFAGSMEYRNMTDGFASSYDGGISYLRDEGYAVMQVFSWGNEYASRFNHCGDDQPFPVLICLKCILEGIRYMTDRYNIDPDNVHVVAKSVGGIIANYFVSHPIYPFKSISMFDPCLDFISMRGRYAGGRQAIAAALDLQGDLSTFYQCSYYYYSADGKAFWSQNKEKLIQLNPAWADLVGGTFEENFDDSFSDAQTWWSYKRSDTVYTHSEYKRLGRIPTKIWGAPDDSETPYQIMKTTVDQLQNGGLFAVLRVLPTGTGGHSASTGNTNVVASITTQLGIECTNVPIGWAECVPWMRCNDVRYSVRQIPS